ncbi:hypothetical protein ACT4VK_11140 [Acinetobacter baumannii]|uniref:hypothetical protein n=1 Tax=Acinetobacter TaxID=469 RepID=UPI0008392252|nr:MULTISPECIES: hypothetical protein [Acinetobacter]MDC5614193.1 hypothetical protein [Acinetobacter baumannii]MCU4589771.1 hypothetical protein [Acinetobacter ursingii]MCY3230452.1 hypothetical protein [Acinetobacter pittii]MDQ9037970.1 hypothetical protein [Acinetobacter seifertii]OCZ07005.1 hypothetical protein BFR95_13180 [Acinetobacter pittii]
MPKFIAGETSKAVLAEKEAKTESLSKKANLIRKISSKDDLYPSLVIKRKTISLSSVLQWEDHELGVIKCVWNTAHEAHNAQVLKALLEAIDLANLNLNNEQSGEQVSTKTSSSSISKEDLNLLIQENEELRNALAEVYRAYIQTLENIKEDKTVNEVLQSLLRNQALILGKQRIWQLK